MSSYTDGGTVTHRSTHQQPKTPDGYGAKVLHDARSGALSNPGIDNRAQAAQQSMESQWAAKTYVIGLVALLLTGLGLLMGLNANQLASWTAEKDYREYCADKGLTTDECRKAEDGFLRPPPELWGIVKISSMSVRVRLIVAFLVVIMFAVAFITICFRSPREIRTKR